MKNIVTAGIVMTCLLASAVAKEDVKRLIDKVPTDHPRLFLKRGTDDSLRKKIASDPLLRRALEHTTAFADGLMDAPPVERKKTGRRLLGVSRTCLQRVTHLAFAFRMTGKNVYAARAQKEMLAAAGFSDWNPSHFLDVGEMTAALAIGYDWTYEALTPEARRTIRDAILTKGLKTSLEGGWWVDTTNNWNPVCHGGLTLGALALLEDEPELAARIVERAIAKLPRATAEYAPDGAYPEGPGYWKYGTTFTVLLIAALESVLGTDFGLTDDEGFLECADYYLHATGPTGLYFNYSDCGSKGGVAPAMYWFAARRKQPSLLWRQKPLLETFLDRSTGSGSDRLFPFLILWAGPLDAIPAPEARHWKADGKTPVAMHRSGWKTEDALFAALKGGSPGENHAHMDIGSFVIDAGGVRWAVDLGSQSYHSLESKGINLWGKSQNSQRWDIFRLNNFSHNTLVVDGRKQRVSGFAPIVGFSGGTGPHTGDGPPPHTGDGPAPHTIVDMTSVYADQLAAAKRGLSLRDNRSVLIRDEIETLDRKTTVRWGMVTRAKVSIEGNRALLRQGDREMHLVVFSPPDASLELFETAKPPREYDAPNRGTRMVGFRVECPPSVRSTFVVLLGPRDAVKSRPESGPLAEW